MIDPKNYAYGVGLTRNELTTLINACTLAQSTGIVRSDIAAIERRLRDILNRREAGDYRDLPWIENAS